jgi:hypothetical protein
VEIFSWFKIWRNRFCFFIKILKQVYKWFDEAGNSKSGRYLFIKNELATSNIACTGSGREINLQQTAELEERKVMRSK